MCQVSEKFKKLFLSGGRSGGREVGRSLIRTGQGGLGRFRLGTAGMPDLLEKNEEIHFFFFSGLIL